MLALVGLLAMSTFGDREGLLSPLHEARYIYTCGWKFDLLAQALFDGELAPVGRRPTKLDVALDGMGGPHRCPGGLSRVVHMQGERSFRGPATARPANGHYYIGPLERPIPGALQVYYVVEAFYRLPRWQRTGTGMRRQPNSGQHGVVYAATNCYPHRERAFDALSRVVESVAIGKCCGSHPELRHPSSLSRAQYNSNYLVFRDYRYVLCMENHKVTGYITEKILYAFAGGAVPIYYGTLEVFDLFNREAFIYYDPNRPEAALARVAYLEGNRTAYDEMVHKPVFAPGSFSKHFGEVLKRRVNGLIM